MIKGFIGGVVGATVVIAVALMFTSVIVDVPYDQLVKDIYNMIF